MAKYIGLALILAVAAFGQVIPIHGFKAGDCIGGDYKPIPCPATAGQVDAKVQAQAERILMLEAKVAIQQNTLEGMLVVLKSIIAERDRLFAGIERILAAPPRIKGAK